ncbi:MAG: two-component system phosphate regulon sensor histidine kinase PhoR [Paracoccaceae bacterium]|jgi:two-component system phosphate regulon sensor histidine kinase PhoR
MAQPRIPFGRLATLTTLASLPPTIVFGALAVTERLDWNVAIGSVAISVLMLGWMVRRGLGDVYRILEFSQTLARDGEGDLPAQNMSGLFPEFTEAVTRLQQAWGHDRGLLGARASSAETIVESLPQPLILLDENRQIVRVTAGAKQLLGDITAGRDLSSVIRTPQILEAVDTVLAGDRDQLIEFDIEFPAMMSLSAQIQRLNEAAADGSVLVLALFDVTEIKKTQKMRTDFVANASHELRTPLAVLSGSIKTLQGPAQGDPEGQAKFLDMMEQHTTRMTRLIDDLLSLSRIELSASMVPEGTVDLYTVLSNITVMLEVPAAQRNIKILLEPGLGVRHIVGDEVEISQLFQNLIDNAVKYSNENSTIQIGLRETIKPTSAGGHDDMQYLEVSVADEGAGIPPEHIPRLTERFYRVDAARSREMGGTGLGLAIVKHIVGRHRGILDIHSVEGEGATFTVCLPISLEKAPVAREETPEEMREEITTPSERI